SVLSYVQRFPTLANEPSRLLGIIQRFAQMRSARLSRSTVRVLPGQGGLLYPFWVVDLRYSFQTGALWTKQGKEVSEYLLVAANASTEGGWNPAGGVTNIFAARMKGGMFDGLTGKETSISGGGLGQVLAQSTVGYLAAPAIPAFTSEADASEMATNNLHAM